MLPLIEKYRAKTFDEIKGQDIAIEEIKAFFKSFPKKRALILNGPAGTGKTSLVLALANELNLELFELNASDLRDKKRLESVLAPATEQHSLFKKGKIILMDEADGISGSDRGGLPELIVLIARTSFPIIITSNDIWDRKFSLLRQKCKVVSLKELRENIIIEIMKDVLKKENKSVRPETLNIISKKSKGDVRAALNDLQSVISFGEGVLLYEKEEELENDLEILEISEREKQRSIFDSLQKVFQSSDTKNVLEAFDNVDAELDEIMLWIEENIPRAYSGAALEKAFDSLSKADLFKGRIYRHQYWRFLVYQNFFLTSGISAATKLKYNKFTKYERPMRILKIWMANQKNAKKKSIISKYAQHAHMSKKKAMKDQFILPLLISQEMEDKLDLEEGEREFLREKREALVQGMK